MIWAQFVIASGIIIVSGYKLSRYGDQIARRTGLGQTLLGIILFSTLTSLPELTVCITSTSIVQSPDLAIGNTFGSNLFNLLLIAIFDIIQGRGLSSTCSHGAMFLLQASEFCSRDWPSSPSASD